MRTHIIGQHPLSEGQVLTLQRRLICTSAALLMSTGMAAAQSAGCQAVNGYFTPSSLISGVFTGLAFAEGETVKLTADSLTSDGGFMFPGSGTAGGAFRFVDGSYNTLSDVFVYPAGSGAVSETLVMPAGVVGLGWSEDVMAGGFFTEFTNLALTCGMISPLTFNPDLARVAAAGQQRSINNALGRNINSRFGRGGENVATRNSVFVSTQNFAGDQQMDVSAWGSLSSRAYFDGYEGHSTDLLFGADYLVNSDTLLGVMLGAGISDLEDDSGNDAETDALLVGVYGGHRFSGSDIILDGYLAYAAVDYDTGATEFDTDRILAGLTVSGTYDVPAGTISPRARLLGTWEDFPAGTVDLVGGTTSEAIASIGAEMTWNTPLPGTSLLPYVSLDLEYASLEEVDGSTDDFFAPRLGFGVSGAMFGGDLALSIDAGRTTSNVTDVGFDVSYAFTF